MRVLLINPPDSRSPDFVTRVGIVPPLGLAYLAAVLEREGHEVQILDALAEGTGSWEKYGHDDQIRHGLSDAAIMWEIEQFDPDIVGVTVPFSAREWDTLNVCRIVKTVNSKIKVIVGGAHPTCCPSRFLRDSNVDYVIDGEGEAAILEIINRRYDARGIGSAGDYVDLKTLPLPARHLLSMEKYTLSDSPHSGYSRKPYTNMITSRGCPHRCRFCVIRQIWGKKVRYRSPESVLAEIDHLVTTYGIREVQFEDDNFLSNRKRALEILKGCCTFDLALASPSGLAVGTLDDEILELMHEAGYYSISLAVESGSHSTLQRMRKPVNLKMVPHVVQKIQSLGMRAKAFFILGYPGESRGDVEKTISFAGELGLDWAIFFPCTAIPGSELETECRERGWLAKTDMKRLFYRPNIRTDQFDPDWVMAKVEEANERVNGYSKWQSQLANVVKHYPHLEWAMKRLEVLNGTAKTI